jgi:hypothetical protein
VIGPEGIVQWSYQAPSLSELPSVDLLREGVNAA